MDTSTLPQRLHPASAFIPMDELRALYRTLLPDHRDRLDALRAQVQAEAASAEEREAAWAEILREAHTLKGSGGQFGFPEITDAALALRQAAPDARPALLNALYEVVVAAMESEDPAPDSDPVSHSAPVTHSADTQRPMAQRPLSVPSTTARRPVAMQSDASQTDAPARTEEAATCKGRVLVVEDDPLIASVICNTLQRRGYAPTHCDLGTRALALLYDEGQPCEAPPDSLFDLALLDISMPGVSGLDVLARIRREPATADLPVMMVSAHIDASTITYARSLGADDYLTKPFSPDTLLRHVSALASARAAAAPTALPLSASEQSAALAV